MTQTIFYFQVRAKFIGLVYCEPTSEMMDAAIDNICTSQRGYGPPGKVLSYLRLLGMHHTKLLQALAQSRSCDSSIYPLPLHLKVAPYNSTNSRHFNPAVSDKNSTACSPTPYILPFTSPPTFVSIFASDRVRHSTTHLIT